jgi:hypothetical protein
MIALGLVFEIKTISKLYLRQQSSGKQIQDKVNASLLFAS